MDFEIYLTEQLRKHPSMQPQDVIKACYQAAFGAEHLLSDPDGARTYLQREYDEVAALDDVLYEQISDQVCRINLSAWKAKGLPLEWLFRMFSASCKVQENAGEQFAQYLQAAERVIQSENAAFTAPEWATYLRAYKQSGMPAVHHSQAYREGERPAYRIVSSLFCDALAILEKANAYAQKNQPCVIAIDGRAASGKTTLANCLQLILDADVIHMDDFFVPPALRSKERFEKPGENIHHERFICEVLPFLAKQEPFSYRIFDCSTMDYHGIRKIGSAPFRIVEGSYSCHVHFGTYADITVFSDVSANEQADRIRKRNGEEMLKMFLTKWIPMEEAYFSHYAIKENADILLTDNSSYLETHKSSLAADNE